MLLLTHWGRVTHICVSRLTITGSDNGLSPGRRQAIIWTNAGIVLIGPLGTNFSENLIDILTFSFRKMLLKVSSTKWRPFWLGLNVLTWWSQDMETLSSFPALCDGNPLFTVEILVTGAWLSQRTNNAELWCSYFVSSFNKLVSKQSICRWFDTS